MRQKTLTMTRVETLRQEHASRLAPTCRKAAEAPAAGFQRRLPAARRGFRDLIDAFVAGQLLEHGVSLQTVRKVDQRMEHDLRACHPFARGKS